MKEEEEVVGLGESMRKENKINMGGGTGEENFNRSFGKGE